MPTLVGNSGYVVEARGTGASRGDSVLSYFLRHLITV
jgi:hypothetical protein